jgi:SPP1 family predicted phage head-tail adaptor
MPMQPCVRCEILKKIGPMNRSVQIQQSTDAQDDVGQPIEVWETIRGWRAARKDVQGWERLRADQEVGARTSVFTGRWFAANMEMRLLHDDMTWDIEGLAELGRRDFLEITATAVRV